MCRPTYTYKSRKRYTYTHQQTLRLYSFFPSSFPSFQNSLLQHSLPLLLSWPELPAATCNSGKDMENYGQLFVEETTLYNRIVLGGLLPERLWTPLPHFVQGWLRNYIAGTLLYFISGFLWCFYIYYLKRNVYIPKGTIFTSFYSFFKSWFIFWILCFVNW